MASSPKHTALTLVLLCAATIMAASSTAAKDVESYSFPVFNVNTTDNLVVATNMSVITPASLLFQPERPFPEVNVSEGFLLLPDMINLWRAGGAGGPPAREASFNTSFTVESSASPISFVILLDRYPTFNNPVGLRGANDSAAGAAVPNATADGLAAVEVGTVKSYAPDSPDVGLNVTVTPNGTAAAAVWVEYDAAAHVLHVYVGAAGGEPRPSRALLDTPLSLAGRQGSPQTSPFGVFVGQGTTETTLVGLFAGTVRDIFVGVRDWDLTVDRLDGKKKKGTSWWVILIAVLGSVAAAIAIVSMVVWCFVSRRRARNMEPKL
ncbi:uncharacterized protein LOC124658072 [Lolium rigidum]|uniref:uncharacterized protein LOC124658072 n=1 Tax=Lolium rigidum TaxID=89674 RepID=UPI001F5CBC86|nr:uncharacterized protein LOC124658072 [Lolium rigidum]